MRRSLPLVMAFLAFFGAGCGMFGGEDKKPAESKGLQNAPAVVLPGATGGSQAYAAREQELRDAVGAMNVGTPGRDGGRAFFDGDTRGGVLPEETVVSGGAGGKGQDPNSLINAPARKDTLTINDVPSPLAQDNASPNGKSAGVNGGQPNGGGNGG